MSQSRGCAYCSVYGCMNTSTTKPDISFFKHPVDVERRTKWLHLIGREELINKPAKNYAVCEDHFKVQDVLPGKIRKTLKRNALPALCLPTHLQLKSETDMVTSVKVEPIEEPADLSPETTETVQPPSEPTRKRKSESPSPESCKTNKLQEPRTSKLVYMGQDTFQKLCDTFLTKELADLVKVHINLKPKSAKKKNDIKQFCLNLYHTSPQVYRMLQRALHLPCPTTLHNDLTQINTAINCIFMSILTTKVESMTDMEKNCSAVINVIPLKASLFYHIKKDKLIGFQEINGMRSPEPAQKAYVMMVRGIFDDWKQPAGYALLSKCDSPVEFNEWIDGLLEKLFNIGLNVRTFVSDTGNDFINAANNRSVTIEKPYFFINNNKIYYIFDAPHLIKLVRNHFIEHDFFFQGRLAKYEHILHFYNKDKNKEFKLAPKLTKSHIRPTNFEKMKLQYATQLFSNSVATGISTYVDFHDIDASGRNTADFIKLMNNLFDSLNSSELVDNSDNKSAFRGKELQIEFLNEMLIFFQNLKLIYLKAGCDITYQVKFIQGFQITITSILQLFNDIKSEGYTFLLTRRLNLEVLEHFFDQIRTKNGMASEPTTWQFESAFRKYFLSNIIKSQKRKISADDLAKFLNQINKLQCVDGKELIIGQKLLSDLNDANEKEENDIIIKSSDYNQWELPEKNSLFEVCNYLLRKCAEKHKDCELFKSYIKPYKNMPNFSKDSRYKYFRVYSKDQCKSLVLVPCDNFVEFVKELDISFVSCFKRLQTGNNLAACIFGFLTFIRYDSPPCPCFPKTYLMKLFTRLRIYNVIKCNNIAFGLSQAHVGRLFVFRL